MGQNKSNSLCLYSVVSKSPFSIWLFVITLTLTSCTNILRRDNTTEINPISCGDGKSFVYPIEFDEDGEVVHNSQFQNIIQSLNKNQIQDVFIFVHGWNNTVPVAKENYEKFICRFRPFNNNSSNKSHTKATTNQNSIAISLFWPSTVNPNSVDSPIMMLKTYYDIRDRADKLANTGFQKILLALQDMEYTRQGHLRLHLVGHSFGGRIVASGIFSFLTNMKNHPTLLFEKLDRLDLVLLLAAIPNNALDTHNLKEEVMAQAEHLSTEDIIGKEKAKEYDRRFAEAIDLAENPHDDLGGSGSQILGPIFAWLVAMEEGAVTKKELEERKLRASKSLRELSIEYDRLKIFTIYSENDDALGFAFPLASIFNKDLVGCALGGCGAAADEKIITNAQVNLEKEEKLSNARMLGIDATALIAGHTDIYKDQVAELIWKLLFTEKSGP